IEKNELASHVETKSISGPTDSYGVTLQYPSLKGSIYLTYKNIGNNPDNLMAFLRDAQKFTQEHTRKADEIIEQPYENRARKVYVYLYDVGGNAAAQSQFCHTDSIYILLPGSFYFYAKKDGYHRYPGVK